MKTILYTKRANVFILKLVLFLVLFLFLASVFAWAGIRLFFQREAETFLSPDKRVVIVLDAGHGGIDGGAEVNGIFEKDLNLQIADKVRSFLELYNVQCEMTRTDDTLLTSDDAKHKKQSDLTNRVKLVRSFENPVFVSIHMNKFPQKKYSGLQVFYSKNDPKSESLALVVQDNVVKHLQKENTRKVKEAGTSIFVLDRLFCPAILIECGFLSNDAEREKLCLDEYQTELAFLISTSIIEYLSL